MLNPGRHVLPLQAGPALACCLTLWHIHLLPRALVWRHAMGFGWVAQGSSDGWPAVDCGVWLAAPTLLAYTSTRLTICMRWRAHAARDAWAAPFMYPLCVWHVQCACTFADAHAHSARVHALHSLCACMCACVSVCLCVPLCMCVCMRAGSQCTHCASTSAPDAWRMPLCLCRPSR